MTGNPSYGLAGAFSPMARAMTPDLTFASRSTEPSYDLVREEDQDALASLAANFDIFINNSYIGHFVQVELARKIWTKWRQMGKSGYLINIGSSATDLVRPDNRLYPVSKNSLLDLSRRLYLHSIWEDSKIRVTYLSFGGIATTKTLETWPHYQHLETNFCAELLISLLRMPETVNIDFLQASPIQPMARRKIKKSEKAKADETEFLVSEF